MKIFFKWVLAIAFIVFLAFFLQDRQAEKNRDINNIQYVKIAGQIIRVELALTQEEQKRGLSSRKELKENEGMLFIFPNEAFQGFWMKNTLIPLDVIWISGEGKVVDIQTLQPCDTEECSISQPIEKAQYVLEVGAESFEGGVGNSVKIEKE